MNLPTLLTALGLIALTTLPAHASQSIVRVKCDREGALLFVNNKPKGKCSATFFKELFLKPGSYVISAKKEQPDKSYYYFEENLEVYGDTVEKLLAEVKELRYPEQYYWIKCQKSINGCFEYQEVLPQGSHIKQVQKKIEEYRWAKCQKSMDGCFEYQKILPQGSHLTQTEKKIENYYWAMCLKNSGGCFEYQKRYRQGPHIKQVKKILANKPKPHSVWKDSTTDMEFIFIPGSCYQMGDTFKDGASDEQPVHEVCVDDFWMGKYEVTIAEFRKYLQATGSTNGVSWDDSDCPIKNNGSYSLKGNKYGKNTMQPMIEVSWKGAKGMADWMAKKVGRKISLPTEAQWEYAARNGGKNVRFGTGKDTTGPDEVNFDARQNYKKSYSRSGIYRKKTVPVGSFSANSLGLFNMSGNVWEWCSDWYDIDYYKSSPRNNPQGPISGSYRVTRGGSWINYPRDVRAAKRRQHGIDFTDFHLGFRLSFPEKK